MTKKEKATISDVRGAEMSRKSPPEAEKNLYAHDDMTCLQNFRATSIVSMETLDELLKRDVQREKDGYPKKIKVGKIVRPQNQGVIVVPTTSEDKFVHGNPAIPQSGGQGDEEEGEVLSEHDIEQEEGEGEGSVGQGGGGDHEIEQNAYELGKALTEKFELPNLKETSKKSSLYEVHYDLTDVNRGSGQILNKRRSLLEIIKTNISLGILNDPSAVNPEDFLVAPGDRVFNVLSEEREYKSTAVVFFVRDYSGSMHASPTNAVLSIHLLIYSWLMYQYMEQVTTRFILHDTEAKEVPDFDTYYRSRVAGGTQVESAYKLVNQIVEDEGLASDNNVYVFHGTDGDDWEDHGEGALEQVRQMMEYCNRIGITIAENGWNTGKTTMEKYFKQSTLLDHDMLLRMDSFQALNVSDDRLIESMKWIIS